MATLSFLRARTMLDLVFLQLLRAPATQEVHETYGLIITWCYSTEWIGAHNIMPTSYYTVLPFQEEDYGHETSTSCWPYGLGEHRGDSQSWWTHISADRVRGYYEAITQRQTTEKQSTGESKWQCNMVWLLPSSVPSLASQHKRNCMMLRGQEEPWLQAQLLTECSSKHSTGRVLPRRATGKQQAWTGKTEDPKKEGFLPSDSHINTSLGLQSAALPLIFLTCQPQQ